MNQTILIKLLPDISDILTIQNIAKSLDVKANMHFQLIL